MGCAPGRADAQVTGGNGLSGHHWGRQEEGEQAPQVLGRWGPGGAFSLDAWRRWTGRWQKAAGRGWQEVTEALLPLGGRHMKPRGTLQMWNVVPVLCAACPGALVCPSSWGKRACRVASLILIQLPRTLWGPALCEGARGGAEPSPCAPPHRHTLPRPSSQPPSVQCVCMCPCVYEWRLWGVHMFVPTCEGLCIYMCGRDPLPESPRWPGGHVCPTGHPAQTPVW